MGKVKDPYMLDSESTEDLVNATKSGSAGVLCPKKNPNLGGVCAVCNKVSQLFQGSEEEVKQAYKLMAKYNWYANVIFPENKSKVVIMEMGKKAGDTILYNVKNKPDWISVAHPKAGIGRELMITKKKGDLGYNEYLVEASMNVSQYDIEEEVVEGRYNLDDIIELLTTEEVFKVSSLKLDESITFRLLPPWDLEKKWPLMFVCRHWGVTEAEVRGEVPIDFDKPEPGEKLPWEANTESPVEKEKLEEEKVIEGTSDRKKREPCFGNANCFEEDDTDCKACGDYKACMKKVLKGKDEE